MALIRLNHALATIAQVRMLLAHANSWPMTPATRAFLVRCFRDRSARFFCLSDCQIAQNKKFLQFFLIDFRGNIGIGMQNHRRLQSISDRFLLTSALNRLADYAAQSQKPRNLSARSIMPTLRFRKFLQMNRTARFRVPPRFLGGEGENRREQSAERIENLAHRGLCRATA